MLSFSLSHEESLFIIMAPLRAFVALPSLVINNADMPNGAMNYCHLTLLEIQKDWKILLSRFNFFFKNVAMGPLQHWQPSALCVSYLMLRHDDKSVNVTNLYVLIFLIINMD